jgi:site-specific DNA-cytosine methylase
VTSHGAGAVVDPCLELVEPILEPATGDVDQRRVVEIDGQPYLLDIRFRMLQTRELARAMGFDDGESEYLFRGTIGEVTKQIGNAVAVNTAKALVLAVLGQNLDQI